MRKTYTSQEGQTVTIDPIDIMAVFTNTVNVGIYTRSGIEIYLEHKDEEECKKTYDQVMRDWDKPDVKDNTSNG